MFIVAFVVVVVRFLQEEIWIICGQMHINGLLWSHFLQIFHKFSFRWTNDPRTKSKWVCWLYRHIWNSNCANLKLVHRFQQQWVWFAFYYELMMTGLLIRMFCIVCKMPIGLVGELKITSKLRYKKFNCKIFWREKGTLFVWMILFMVRIACNFFLSRFSLTIYNPFCRCIK